MVCPAAHGSDSNKEKAQALIDATEGRALYNGRKQGCKERYDDQSDGEDGGEGTNNRKLATVCEVGAQRWYLAHHRLNGRGEHEPEDQTCNDTTGIERKTTGNDAGNTANSSSATATSNPSTVPNTR